MDGNLCKICNKNYASYKSLWNHNKKFHKTGYTQNVLNLSSQKVQNIPILSSVNEDKNNKCIKCDKQLSSYKNKWRHEKTCKINTETDIISELKCENLEIKKQHKELYSKFNELLKLCKIHPKTLQKINNQIINTNNGTINNTMNIVKFGSEDFNKILSQSEILKILNKKMCSLEESIKTIHFNDKRPEFKNVYITNLKDQYAYVFDGNKFTAGLKSDIIGEMVDNHFENIEMSVDEYKDKLQPKTVEVLDKFIEKMNDDMEEFTDNMHKKIYPNYKSFKINIIKLLIYNETDSRTNVVNVICDKIELPELN